MGLRKGAGILALLAVFTSGEDYDDSSRCFFTSLQPSPSSITGTRTATHITLRTQRQETTMRSQIEEPLLIFLIDEKSFL